MEEKWIRIVWEGVASTLQSFNLSGHPHCLYENYLCMHEEEFKQIEDYGIIAGVVKWEKLFLVILLLCFLREKCKISSKIDFKVIF